MVVEYDVISVPEQKKAFPPKRRPKERWDLKYGRKDLEDRGTKNSESEIVH